MNLSDLCWFCRTGSGGGSGGSRASGLRRGIVTPGAASALGERSSIPVDGEQYLCVCCMCSELKRILPSPHIPETPQQRFVLYFSLKFGCKAVTRGEERFNLVLGPQKPYGCSHIFLLSLPTRAMSVSCWPGWRGLAGRQRGGWWRPSSPAPDRASVCPGGVLQTQDRPIECIIDYSCYFWHHLLIWQTKGALWKKRSYVFAFPVQIAGCPGSEADVNIKVF